MAVYRMLDMLGCMYKVNDIVTYFAFNIFAIVEKS